MDPKMRESFTKKKALQSEAEEKNKDAQAAAAEKKASWAAKEAEKMRAVKIYAAEALASKSIIPLRGAVEGGARDEDAEDHAPLQQRKGKATEDPSTVMVEGGSLKIPHTGPEPTTSLWASSEFGFQVTQENIFKDVSLDAGAQIFKGLLTQDEEAHLQGIGLVSSYSKLRTGSFRYLSSLFPFYHIY